MSSTANAAKKINAKLTKYSERAKTQASDCLVVQDSLFGFCFNEIWNLLILVG